MVTVTICSDFGAPKKSLSLFVLFPHLFTMKLWDRMPFSYSYAIMRNHFLIRLWHAMKNGLYMTCNNQLNGWTEKKLQSPSQSQICTKKRSWPLFGGLLPIWFTSVFWIQVKPLHLITMLCKSLWCTENFSTCSCQQKGPNSSSWLFLTAHCTTNSSKVEWIGLQSFASSAILTWPLTKQLPLLQASWQLFSGKTFPQPAGCRKCFPRESNSKAWVYAAGISKLISHWQKCVDFSGFYFD